MSDDIRFEKYTNYIAYLEDSLTQIRGILFDPILSTEEKHQKIDAIVWEAASSDVRMQCMEDED